MPDDFDRQLYDLYCRLGDHYSTSGNSAEAADGYALALYYARRLGDDVAMERCRQQVAQHHPRHVAAGDKVEPLFFAQLLIRYPADEAQQLLQSQGERRAAARNVAAVFSVVASPMSYAIPQVGRAPSPSRQSPTRPEHDARTVASSQQEPKLLEREPAIALDRAAPPASAPIPERTVPATVPPPVAADKTSAMEHHHVFDLGTRAAADHVESLRAVEDVLLKNAVDLDEQLDDDEATSPSPTMNLVAAFAVFVGFVAIGFFAYELHPALSRIGLDGIVERVSRSGLAGLLGSEKVGPSTNELPGPADSMQVTIKPLQSSPYDRKVGTAAPAAGDSGTIPPDVESSPVLIGLGQRAGKPRTAQ